MPEDDQPISSPSAGSRWALLDDVALARGRPSAATLHQIREWVGRALGAPVFVPATPEISGYRVNRRPIRAGDPVDVRLAKYIQHAAQEEQWPPATTFEEYVLSLQAAVLREQGGIFLDRRGDRWRLTFVSWSGM